MGNNLLLKRELLRSIGIFVITMVITSFLITIFKDYYWSIVVIPTITLLLYLGAIFLWITKTERGRLAEKTAEEMEKQPSIKLYRNTSIGLNMALGSLILLLCVPLLYEYNFIWLITIPILFLSCIIGMYLFISSFDKMRSTIAKEVKKEMTRKIVLWTSASQIVLVLFIVMYSMFLTRPILEIFVIFAFLFAGALLDLYFRRTERYLQGL